MCIWVFLFLPGLILANSYSVCLENEISCGGGCCPETEPFCFVHNGKGKCCPTDRPEFDVVRGQEWCCEAHLCRPPVDAATSTVTIYYDGLLPCGRCLPNPGGVVSSEYDIEVCGSDDFIYVPCQLCHFFILAENILDFIAKNVIYLAVLMIVLAGGILIYSNLASPGNPRVIAEATRRIRAVLIGIAIYFCLFLIVNLLFFTLGVAKTDFGKNIRDWFQVSCAPKLENIQIGGDPGPVRPPECNPPCVFESSGSCPADRPYSAPVTGGVCCCLEGIDTCATINEQKCGMRRIANTDRCGFPYVAGEINGVCCECQDIGGGFLEWRVVEICPGSCSLNLNQKCFDPGNPTDCL